MFVQDRQVAINAQCNSQANDGVAMKNNEQHNEVTIQDPEQERVSERLSASQEAKVVAVENIIAAQASGDMHQLSEHLLAMLSNKIPAACSSVYRLAQGG